MTIIINDQQKAEVVEEALEANHVVEELIEADAAAVEVTIIKTS